MSKYISKDELLKKFEEECEVLLAAGKELAEIQDLHKKDFDAWKADRIFFIHNRKPLEVLSEKPERYPEIDECVINLDVKFEGFIGLIENDAVYQALKELTTEELALIEACVILEISQKEYADRIGRAYSSVSERLNRILNRLKKNL